MVDSMMQAWNGGIPVASPERQPKSMKRANEEGIEESRLTIFSMPPNALNKHTNRKREVSHSIQIGI